MADVPHLTDEQRQAIADKCAIMQQFYLQLQTELETKPKHEDISSSLSDIEKKQMLIEAEVNSILTAPPPAAPKPEEEKKGEENAEMAAEGEGEAAQTEEPAADANMQDEQQQPDAAPAGDGDNAETGN